MNRGRRSKLTVAGALAAVLALGVAACGSDEETEDIDGEEATIVVEGEPLELGDLMFNVAITRFLNPDDIEDAEYLEGLPDPPAGEDYLAVFMTVENEGDDDLRLPTAEQVEIGDITGAVYEPVETESLFALELGRPCPPAARRRLTDTAAAGGPVKGSFVLFGSRRTSRRTGPLSSRSRPTASTA